jgi:hypothetical protein
MSFGNVSEMLTACLTMAALVMSVCSVCMHCQLHAVTSGCPRSSV